MKYLKRFNEDIKIPIISQDVKKLFPKKLSISTSNGEFELVISDYVINLPKINTAYHHFTPEKTGDALSDGEEVFVAGIMQHIEEAGIHSGDSACSIPPYSLNDKIIEEIKLATIKLALALEVQGLMNVQFAVKNSLVKKKIRFVNIALGSKFKKSLGFLGGLSSAFLN